MNHPADYIREMTFELADLARRANLNVLAYLLDVATLEASQQAAQTKKRRAPR